MCFIELHLLFENTKIYILLFIVYSYIGPIYGAKSSKAQVMKEN